MTPTKTKTYRVQFNEGVPVKFRTKGHAWRTMDQAPRALLTTTTASKHRRGPSSSATGMVVITVTSPYTRQALYYQELRRVAERTENKK